jgi:hypothetical protein
MTLQNLLRIGRLKEHTPVAAEIRRLLAAIDRNLGDADIKENSNETRLDVAYKVIMQASLVAMLCAGYQPSTSEPSHHQTMIQSLPLTLGVGSEVWVVLDAMRQLRNANDYTGKPVSDTTTRECIGEARALRDRLHQHLAKHHAAMLAAP